MMLLSHEPKKAQLDGSASAIDKNIIYIALVSRNIRRVRYNFSSRRYSELSISVFDEACVLISLVTY
jgi:hypothetical protein